jgi:flagellar protein FlbT
MRISLRSGEKIYINGAVLRVDRKVSLELLNDATFLLEAHVMRAEDASTPLRQLYFIVQLMLMDPTDGAAREMFEKSIVLMIASYENAEIIAGLQNISKLVGTKRTFDALKAIRNLFPIDAQIMTGGKIAVPTRAA